MTLKDLEGERVLSGVGWAVREGKDQDDDANGLGFVIDGICYVAWEDQDDGYRSCMDELQSSADIPKWITRFENTSVMCKYVTERADQYRTMICQDILQVVSKETGKLVLEAGTDGDDEYYPVFVAHWMPEALKEK